MPPRGRLTVDPDEFALSLLRDALPAGTTVDRWRTKEWLRSLPFVEAHATPGSGRGPVDPGRMLRHRSVAELALEVWAENARDASDLSDAAVAAFHRAWRGAHTHAGGHLSLLELFLAPGEVRDAAQPGGVRHWSAALVLHLRPARP